MENNFTPEMIEKAKAAKTPEELLTIAKENKIELTADEAKEYYDKLNKSGELADDELDNVAGGGCSDDFTGNDFLNAYNTGSPCPNCHKGTVKKYDGGNLEPSFYYCTYCSFKVCL